MSVRIVALRHPITPCNERRCIQGGRANHPHENSIKLHEGQRQTLAAAVAIDKLDLGIDAMFVSTTDRTEQMASIFRRVAGFIRIPLTREPRLRERHFGDFEDQPVDDMLQALGLSGWVRELDLTAAGGDHWEDVEAIIREFFQELREEYDGKTVLLFGHGAYFTQVGYMYDIPELLNLGNAQFHVFEI